ncbi:MAG: glycosyltransferase family 9 protein [Ignavibacteria bacterium]|nr:glycosyltransferase family 9 protein [Ignavibacteria bacterium]
MHAPPADAVLPRPPRRILVIKLRAIGDVLLSTIVLNNLRAAWPDADIDFLTETPSRDVVEGHPSGARVIVFHPKKDNPLLFFWRLRRARYDLVIDLFCNPRSAQMAFATRARTRIGYPFRGRAWAYTTHVATRADRVHNTEFNLDAIARAGIGIVDRSVVLTIPAEAAEWAERFLAPLRADGRLLVALNASGTWPTKRWGLEHFAELADRLHAEHNVMPLLLWGPGEEDDVQEIRSRMRGEAVIPPRTSIKQLGALLAGCDAMITNDTGPMHIGAAVGLQVLGIFGPTNPYLQGPFNERSAWVRLDGLECLACNLTACPIGNVCMRDLPVDTVLSAFTALVTSA